MTLSELTISQKRALTYLATDYEYYAGHCLKIVDKSAQLIPFIFNRTQQYIHAVIEKQKADIGMVRIVILKGRQQGCTTYIQGRYFHHTDFKSNVSAFVLAHQAESTLEIFSMSRKFWEELPSQLQRPLKKDTERAMVKDNGSSYTVGTAGSAQIGRGMTVQLFHGSEVAFYENADQLSTGLMQTVADMPGTELIFESTANGPGNFFYELVMGAIAGTNGLLLIFIPWYWQDEYRNNNPLTERDLDEEEHKYYDLHKDKGLTLPHLAWRRVKLASFGGKKWKFIQEYPFTPEEAFVRAAGRFFDLAKVYLAKQRTVVPNKECPLILGIDQGRTGDPTTICRRQGKKIFPIEEIPSDDGYMRDMRLAGRAADIIEREKPDLVVFDTTNEHGALDRLHELGYSRQLVKGIHFGERANDPQRHRNKRVEMHFDFRDWLVDEDTDIPDDQKLISEIGSIPEEKETSNNVKWLVSKDEIKKDLGWSPNRLDSVILTFAFRVRKRKNPHRTPGQQEAAKKTPVIFRSTLRSKKGY